MQLLTFRAAAENEFASPARMTASFDIELDDEVYALMAEKAPEKSRSLQEIDLYDFEEINYNDKEWSLREELNNRAERALVDKYSDVFLRKEISWITDVYEITVYWPRELTKSKTCSETP